MKHPVIVRIDPFLIKSVNNLFRVSNPDCIIAMIFQVHNLSNFVLSAHKICLIVGSYVQILSKVVDVGHHLFLNKIQVRWIIMDQARNIINDVRKCSLFQSSISFVMASIIIIEKIQNIGLNEQVKLYRIAICFHCFSGRKNLLRFSELSSELFLAIH